MILRLTEGLFSWAVLLQALEGLSLCRRSRMGGIHLLRAGIAGWALLAALLGRSTEGGLFLTLGLLGLVGNLEFAGLFNGASDRMTLMLACALGWAAGGTGSREGAPTAILWIGILSVLSYFLSGLRKAFHRRWWTGEMLADFLRASRVRAGPWAFRLASSRALGVLGPAVLIFQLVFPFLVFQGVALPWVFLGGGLFHLGNFVFFGLNRFFWIWIATYPSIFWLSGHLPSLR